MVAEIIEQKKDEIAALCRKHGVRALWVFGSATTDAFDPETSDLDFLVDLGDYSSDYASRFFRTSPRAGDDHRSTGRSPLSRRFYG